MKLDLNNLQEEINSRKQAKGITDDVQQQPKYGFLNKLIEARETGRLNEATNLIKLYDGKMEEKSKNVKLGVGLKPDAILSHIEQPIQLNENLITQTPSPSFNKNQQAAQINNDSSSQERDNGIYAEVERRMSEYKKTYGASYPMNNIPQNNNAINGNYPVNNNTGSGMMITEGTLNEIERKVTESISGNLGTIIKEAMQNTIIELYTANKVKNIVNENTEIGKTMINENKDLIKKIIYEVLRELQKTKK